MRVERIGDATLYCGDAMDVLEELRPGDADLVVVDPPYMIGVASSGTEKLNPWADLLNGARFFQPVIQHLKRITYPHGGVWWFCNWRGVVSVQKAVFDCAWKIESMLVWDKCWIGPGGTKGLRPSYEMVALLAQGDFGLPNRGLPDIKRSAVSSQKPNGHPAEKPADLCHWLISESPGGTVLDPFMGSGTTGEAAMSAGRKFIGIEIDERWFDVACRRIERAQSQPRMFAEPRVVNVQEPLMFAGAAA